jgi:structural maintenance of chromosome 1
MDALSFVLGIKTSQLRSGQLKDLIYHGDSSADSASVSAVFIDAQDQELTLTRSYLSSLLNHTRIHSNTQGSEYYINGSLVPWATYNETLENQNILVKAKNFLVFQVPFVLDIDS